MKASVVCSVECPGCPQQMTRYPKGVFPEGVLSCDNALCAYFGVTYKSPTVDLERVVPGSPDHYRADKLTEALRLLRAAKELLDELDVRLGGL